MKELRPVHAPRGVEERLERLIKSLFRVHVYGPLLAVSGPPVAKPLVRPGSADAVRRLWQVAERETGLPVDPAAVVRPR